MESGHTFLHFFIPFLAGSKGIWYIIVATQLKARDFFIEGCYDKMARVWLTSCHFQRPCFTFKDTSFHLNPGPTKAVTFTYHSSSSRSKSDAKITHLDYFNFHCCSELLLRSCIAEWLQSNSSVEMLQQNRSVEAEEQYTAVSGPNLPKVGHFKAPKLQKFSPYSVLKVQTKQKKKTILKPPYIRFKKVRANISL